MRTRRRRETSLYLSINPSSLLGRFDTIRLKAYSHVRETLYPSYFLFLYTEFSPGRDVPSDIYGNMPTDLMDSHRRRVDSPLLLLPFSSPFLLYIKTASGIFRTKILSNQERHMKFIVIKMLNSVNADYTSESDLRRSN